MKYDIMRHGSENFNKSQGSGEAEKSEVIFLFRPTSPREHGWARDGPARGGRLAHGGQARGRCVFAAHGARRVRMVLVTVVIRSPPAVTEAGARRGRRRGGLGQVFPSAERLVTILAACGALRQLFHAPVAGSDRGQAACSRAVRQVVHLLLQALLLQTRNHADVRQIIQRLVPIDSCTRVGLLHAGRQRRAALCKAVQLLGSRERAGVNAGVEVVERRRLDVRAVVHVGAAVQLARGILLREAFRLAALPDQLELVQLVQQHPLADEQAGGGVVKMFPHPLHRRNGELLPSWSPGALEQPRLFLNQIALEYLRRITSRVLARSKNGF